MAPTHTTVSYLSVESSDHEKPLPEKPDGTSVVQSNHGFILLRYWIHLASILMTGGLAAINGLNLFLIDSDNSSAAVILQLFQFIAKIHELLIIGSLTLLLLDAVRARLITPAGAPLGFLLSPFLFNDLGWITTPAFWSCLRATSSSLSITLLVLAAIPLATLSGPLSAITVVPRLGFSRSRVSATNPSFYNASASQIWPTIVSSGSLPPACFTTDAGAFDACPAAAYTNMNNGYNFDPDYAFFCAVLGTKIGCNVTATIQTVSNIPRFVSVDYNVDSLIAFTTTPTSIIFNSLAARFTRGLAGTLNISNAETIDARREFILTAQFAGNEAMYKPVVNTTCTELDSNVINDMTQKGIITTNWTEPDVEWLHDADGSGETTFVFTYRKDDSTFVNGQTCSNQDCYAAIACSIDAKWIPMSLWVNTLDQTSFFQSSPQPAQVFHSHQIQQAKQIVIKTDWLQQLRLDNDTSLGQSLPTTLNQYNVPMTGQPNFQLDRKQSFTGRFAPGNFSQAITLFMGSVIAEGMATLAPPFTTETIFDGDCEDNTLDFPSDVCQRSVSDWVHTTDLGDLADTMSMITFRAQRSGYGFFLNTITVKIALAVLLLHAFFTHAYILHVMLLKPNVVTTWSTASELLVLAINSLQAPSLVGSSAEVRDRSLWQQPVTIRQTCTGDDLSLVVGDPKWYHGQVGGLPEPEKKYN